MILRKLKLQDALEAGVGVRGRAAAFGKSRRREDGGSFWTEDGKVLEFRLGKNNESRSYVPSKSAGWEHPWHTTLKYYTKDSGMLRNAKGEAITGWGAMVKPGFVAGIDPIVSAAPDIDIGEDKDSKPKAGGKGVNAASRREALKVKPGLADRPLIPLISIAAIDRTNKIPKQLRDMGGVGAEPDMNISGTPMQGNLSITAQGRIGGEESNRYVGVTGLHISVARPTFSMEVNSQGFPLSGPIQYNVTYSGQTLGVYGPRPRLNVGIPEPPPEPSFQDRLNGVYQDDGQDVFMICEIFFLSPPVGNVKKDAKNNFIIDSAWRPFVRHACFWNLEYRLKLETPKNVPQLDITSWALPIVGRYTMAPIATANAAESESNRILGAALQRNSPKGKFWTI